MWVTTFILIVHILISEQYIAHPIFLETVTWPRMTVLAQNGPSLLTQIKILIWVEKHIRKCTYLSSSKIVKSKESSIKLIRNIKNYLILSIRFFATMILSSLSRVNVHLTKISKLSKLRSKINQRNYQFKKSLELYLTQCIYWFLLNPILYK